MKFNEHKLREIYDKIIDSDLMCDVNLKTIDFYNLLCKAAAKDFLFNYKGNNLCMFKYKYKDSDSILMIFSIPINDSSDVPRHLTERIMEIIEDIEKCFINLEYVRSIEIKEDKFIYLVCIKKRVDK